MMKRRNFLKTAGAATAVAFVSRHPLVAEAVADDPALHFASDSMELQMSSTAPEFLSLNVDGLGKGKRGANIVLPNRGDGGYKVSASTSGGVLRVAYRSNLAGKDSPPAWTLEFSGSKIVLALGVVRGY
jgi:hypothetical protein